MSATDHRLGEVPGDDRPGHRLSVGVELATRLSALDPADVLDDDAFADARHPTGGLAHPRSVRLTSRDGTDVVLTTDPVTVGRSTALGSVDFAVDGPTVSRRQAQLWADGDVALCVDLGSRNGTVRVRDGERHIVGAGAATLLLPGDVLVTGDDVVLLAVVDGDRSRS